MLDLKNLDVVELNAQEIKETEGGIVPLLLLAAALLFTSCNGCAASHATTTTR